MPKIGQATPTLTPSPLSSQESQGTTETKPTPETSPALVQGDSFDANAEFSFGIDDGTTADTGAPAQGTSMGIMGALALDNALDASAEKPSLLGLQPTFRDVQMLDKQSVAPPMATVAGVEVARAESQTFDVAKSGDYPVGMNRTTDVVFGTLSQAQFDDLHAHFGGHSMVGFDPAREYQLVDFLPPTIQALVNKDLELPPEGTIPGSAHWGEDDGMRMFPEGQDKTVTINMNCHATAWGAMMAYQGNLANPSADSIGKIPVFLAAPTNMENATYIEEGSPGADTSFTKEASFTNENLHTFSTENLQPGDIVQFFDQSAGYDQLLHTATYVGGGMFFEKPNTESFDDEFPFRLAPFDDVAALYKRDFREGLGVSVLRASKELQAPEEQFGSSLTAEGEKIANAQGQTLGVVLTEEILLSMGGGFMGTNLGALTNVGVQLDPETGRGVLDPSTTALPAAG